MRILKYAILILFIVAIAILIKSIVFKSRTSHSLYPIQISLTNSNKNLITLNQLRLSYLSDLYEFRRSARIRMLNLLKNASSYTFYRDDVKEIAIQPYLLTTYNSKEY